MRNCGICTSMILADEHVSRCLHCAAFLCEVCTGEGLQLCHACVMALAPESFSPTATPIESDEIDLFRRHQC